MLKIRVYVSDIAAVLTTWDRVEIGRAATSADAASQTGTFVSLGNVITLQAGVEAYTYIDTAGAEGNWYITRYVKGAGGPAPSDWSVPFEGGSMGYLTAAEFRDYDLTDLTDADGTVLTDDQLDRHIATGSRLLESELNGLSFALRQDTERHRWRHETRRVYPYQRPIVSVVSLKVYVSSQQAASFNVPDLFVNVQSNYVEVTNLATVTYSLFPLIASLGLMEPVAELVYTHGYAAYPQDVKDATALVTSEVLADRRLRKQGIAAGVTALRVGDWQVTRAGRSGRSTPAGNPLVPEAAYKLVSHYLVQTIR